MINKKLFLVFALFISVFSFGQKSYNGMLLNFFNSQNTGLFLNNPTNFNDSISYDPVTNTYFLQKKVGDVSIGDPIIMSFNEYQRYAQESIVNDYWSIRSKERLGNQNSSNMGPVKLYIPGKSFDRVFGGNTVDIRPQGSAELIFGLKINRIDNPALPEDQRRTVSFDFQEKIQANVIGKIGEKLKVTANFNTETTFDFENEMKVEYSGSEDAIIQKIEIGNVSLPLNGTLITRYWLSWIS